MNNINKIIEQYGGNSIPFSKMKGVMNHTTGSKKRTKRHLKKSKKPIQKSPRKSPKKLKDGIILRGTGNKLWKTKKHRWVRIR